MRTIEEQIKVMQHFADGGKIECNASFGRHWNILEDPKFDWSGTVDYRIYEAPETRNMTTEEIAKLDSWKFIRHRDKYPLIISSFDDNGVWFHNSGLPMGDNDHLNIWSLCNSCLQYPSMKPFTVEVESDE